MKGGRERRKEGRTHGRIKGREGGKEGEASKQASKQSTHTNWIPSLVSPVAYLVLICVLDVLGGVVGLLTPEPFPKL